MRTPKTSYAAALLALTTVACMAPSEASRFSLEIGPGSVSLSPGETVQLEVQPGDPGEAARLYTLTWASTDETVASVSGSGLVSAHADGRATVTATAVLVDTGESASASVEIAVGAAELVPVDFTERTAALAPSGELWTASGSSAWGASALALPAGGTGVYQAEWASADNEAAIIALDRDAAPEGYATWPSSTTPELHFDYALYPWEGTYRCVDGGVGGIDGWIDTRIAVGTGDLYRLRRAIESVVAERSSDGGARWTLVHAFATPATSDLYLKADVVYAGKILRHPRQHGAVSPAATPTCTDGLQNGDEAGVDCGGSCAACPSAASCTDGVQNGGELGVDCGGSCPACSGTLIQDVSFQGGTIPSSVWRDEVGDHSLEVVGAPWDASRRALRVLIREGESWNGSGYPRSEITLRVGTQAGGEPFPMFALHTTYRIETGFYFPTDTAFPTPGSAGWAAMTGPWQIHAHNEEPGCAGPLTVALTSGEQHELRVCPRDGSTLTSEDLGTVPQGRYVPVEVIWRASAGADGYVRVTHGGVVVLEQHGPNQSPRYINGGYMKLGLYDYGRFVGAGVPGIQELVMYLDDVRVYELAE